MTVLLGRRYVLGPVVAGARTHEALDRRTLRKVLVKVVLASDRGAWQRLEREMLAARVDHPSVLAPLDIGIDAGVGFLVTPRVRGTTLADAPPLSFGELVRVFADMASALHAVHAAGIVHRDVCLASIFLEHSEGRPPVAKLTSFANAEAGARDAGADIDALGFALSEAVARRRPVPAPEESGVRLVAGRDEVTEKIERR